MTGKLKAFLALLLCLCLLAPTACTPVDNGEDSSANGSNASSDSSVDANSSADTEDSSEGGENVAKNPIDYYMKAAWLFQYSNESLFKTGGAQRAEADYRAKVTKICQNLVRDGYNTLFLQVRGHGDSFYPSELFPPTTYVVGSYTDSFVYDPLEIFCEIAHEHGLYLHAWINPYRLLTVNQMAKVPETYAIGKWYKEYEGDYVVRVEDRYYCNPAYEEVRQLVIDGAVEICKNYDVDGLHIDDYFYPSGVTDNFDALAYSTLGNGRTRKQFRYDSVNALVKGLYDAVHGLNKGQAFGISPGGNMDNNRGYLSADIDTWCSTPGYIDYIAPQVYWSFSHSWDSAKFHICSKNWGDLITTDSVKLIIGIGLYRTIDPTNSSSDPDWFTRKDNIKRMLEHTYGYSKAEGFIMFSYESMYDIMTGEYNPKSAEEQANFLPLLKQEP